MPMSCRQSCAGLAPFPQPRPDEAIFENVYEVLPERVARQRAETIAARK
jgi:hypothetical protein